MAGQSLAWTTRRAGLGPGHEAGVGDAGGGAVLGAALDAHPGLGDDAEDALAADCHAVGAGTGAAAGEAAGLPDAGGGDHADRLDEVVDVGVVGGVVSPGTGGDPAAEGGELEALRVVAQGEAVGAELGLEARAVGSGLDAGGAGDVVDFQHPVEGGEVDGDDTVVALGRLEAGDGGAAATVGDGGRDRWRSTSRGPP